MCHAPAGSTRPDVQAKNAVLAASRPRMASAAPEPSAGSGDDELQHWKDKVAQMHEALRDAETGLQEFMESSKELEAEMEADMAAAHQRADALAAENEQLRADVDEWRVRIRRLTTAKAPGVAHGAQHDNGRPTQGALELARDACHV